MSKKYSVREVTQARNRRQALVMLFLGVVFLLLAWLVHPSTRDYPVGVLVLGLGMLLATLLNPFRLIIASSMVTCLGLATFLFFRQLIPGNQILALYLGAVGLALLVIAQMARQGYIKAGAFTPGVIVIIVSIIEFLLAAGYTPQNFIPFMLSLWLPGIGLLVLGLVYYFTS